MQGSTQTAVQLSLLLDNLARSNGSQAWRRVHRKRSNPPWLVTEERRALFSSSLEQAEQQILAASVTPIQTRPLNAFYGLSQAGRAVAAAYVAGDDYQLFGHGISGPSGVGCISDEADAFPRAVVATDSKKRSGSFVRLSAALNSAVFPNGVDLGTLWQMVVEAQLHEQVEPPRWPVLLSSSPNDSDEVSASASGSVTLTEDTIAGFLDHYPELVGAAPVPGRVAGSSFQVKLARSPDGSLPGTNYRRSRVFMPEVPETGQTMHPLMVWWAILFALSKLARYSPVEWDYLSDVDRSPHAVPIAFLLDAALDAVPDLLAETLDEAPEGVIRS